MNIFGLFERRVADALGRMIAAGDLPRRPRPRRASSSSRRATPRMATSPPTPRMVLAKRGAARTRARWRTIAADLRDDPRVDEAEVAGPGFINLTLAAARLARRAAAPILARRSRLRAAGSGAGEPVNVEYVSANPTGPMHVGHGRGAVFGDALANLLAFAGYGGDARILHQRRRRAGRRAGALGLPALPRGAGRGRSARSRRGSTPAITSKPVGAGARRAARPRAARAARGRMAAGRARRPRSTR